ncbi:hypothetical protein [Pasteurella multocida]|uniref:hypothetical protein n=1 Tax=Pasteurella multocida TaxID=747 RepID=UPI0023E449FC|nr:hypothetical protein [Pasteurella multocida]
MYALDNDSGVQTMPEVKSKQFNSNEPRWFTEGGNGVAPSYPGADWFNIVQAELLGVLTAGGIEPDKANLNQLTLAIQQVVQNKVTQALSSKANSNSPLLTGIPTAPTAPQSTNNTQIATTAFVKAAIAALVGSAPAALDTLQELANALGQDANFRNTIINQIAGKANTNHTHTVSQITDFKQGVKSQFIYQKTGNNEIFKFPDGTLILTGRIDTNTYTGSEIRTKITFPAAFKDSEYKCFVTEQYDPRASGKGQYNWAFMTPERNSSAIISTWYTGKVFWMVIGRWM